MGRDLSPKPDSLLPKPKSLVVRLRRCPRQQLIFDDPYCASACTRAWAFAILSNV